ADTQMFRKLKLNPDVPKDFIMVYSGLDTFDVAYKWGIDNCLDGMLSCTPKNTGDMFKAMANTTRFSGIKLSGFISKHDEKAEKQFAALSISFDKKIYVSFRGTDDSLIGWKEDFNLAFMESVPAQHDAASYLDKVMKEIMFLPVYLGGHSKGGNLSVYAAMKCKRIHKRRIKKIFTNDSPGFLEKVIQSREYKETSEKIVSIVPEGSVIGQLLSHGRRDDIYVKSESSMLRQHDPFTWEVMGKDFVKVQGLSEKSIMIDDVITSWLSKLDKEERESLVEAVFEFFTVTDAKNLGDIVKDKLGFLMALSKLSKESKKDIGKNIGQIIEEIKRIKSRKE
ncbi:MAG: DUF2974 domain-containing protein, partial [Clostridia bacterium]|nr:DUF2974 domain-containing protein [Clostridia bacterium]